LITREDAVGKHSSFYFNDILDLLHDFSEELIGKDEKLPAIQVTAECAEKMGGLIASSKGRNQFRQSQRKLRDKLLVKKQT